MVYFSILFILIGFLALDFYFLFFTTNFPKKNKIEDKLKKIKDFFNN